MRERQIASAWDAECYPGFEADILELAGSGAIDCGILPRSAGAAKSSAPQACLASALPTSTGFRVAHASHGDDSLFCSAVVRASDGKFWSVTYDFDVTGQNSSDGSNAVLWVSRCDRLSMGAGTIGPGSLFKAGDCNEDRVALNRILKARSAQSQQPRAVKLLL